MTSRDIGNAGTVALPARIATSDNISTMSPYEYMERLRAHEFDILQTAIWGADLAIATGNWQFAQQLLGKHLQRAAAYHAQNAPWGYDLWCRYQAAYVARFGPPATG